MIDPSLLDRLQKADPETWKEFNDADLGEYWDYKHDEPIYATELSNDAQEAWLQHVLQDAIAAKGWFYWVQWDTHHGTIAGVNKEHPDKEYMCDDADSPAEALLKCYLAAMGEPPVE